MQTNKLKNQIDPQPLRGILNGNSLHHIIQKAKLLMALNQIFKEILSPELSSFCQVLNLNQGTLIIESTNGAVATRLRYLHHQILNELKNHKNLPTIESLSIKVKAVTEPHT